MDKISWKRNAISAFDFIDQLYAGWPTDFKLKDFPICS